MPDLIVLVGLPFAGKTTLVSTLLNDEVLLIERDRLLELIYQDRLLMEGLRKRATEIDVPVSKGFQTRQQNAFNDVLSLEYVRRVVEIVEGAKLERVVVDGTHLQPLSRSFVRHLPGWKSEAWVLRTSPEECIARLSRKPSVGLRTTVTPEVIQRLASATEWPIEQEGFSLVRDLSSNL